MRTLLLLVLVAWAPSSAVAQAMRDTALHSVVTGPGDTVILHRDTVIRKAGPYFFRVVMTRDSVFQDWRGNGTPGGESRWVIIGDSARVVAWRDTAGKAVPIQRTLPLWVFTEQFRVARDAFSMDTLKRRLPPQ